MRKALIVGIDHYDKIGSLQGAVNDAYSMKSILGHHADGTLNFAQPLLLTGTKPGTTVTRNELRDAVEELFKDDAEIALFYFSGHGYVDGAGGYLCAGPCPLSAKTEHMMPRPHLKVDIVRTPLGETYLESL